ncbi:MAG: PorV/PorQ family protein [Ignavibacteriae bacterium]|nr:PorV/PorQ family protein [Ignavibacteriota bacterium]
MNRTLIAIVTLAMLLLAGASELYAGRGDKAGTSAASELLIPVGGREVALGGSSLASTRGVEAIYWNPAGLARSYSATEALFSHMSYIADIGVDYFAVGSTFEGFGSIGLSLKSLSFGEIEITTEDVPDGTGAFYSPTYVTVGLTYSRLLTDRISVGLTANLISERIDRVSATGVAFDAGVQYSEFAGLRGLSIGVAVKNIGPGMKFGGPGLLRPASVGGALRPESLYEVVAASDELPSTIELGVAYAYQLEEMHQLTASSLFQNNNLSDDEYKFGLEYGFNNTFFVRGGYNLSEQSEPNADYIFGVSAGAGVHYAFSGLDVSIDYAFRDVSFFDANHLFSIKVGF